MIERCWYDDEKDTTYRIRFIRVNDIWYAVLKDVCDAVGLISWGVSQRMETKYLLKRNVPLSDHSLNEVRYRGQCVNRVMTLISEQGIYKAFGGGRNLKARKFTDWWTEMIIKFRQAIGLEGFQIMDMLDTRVQQHITRQVERFLPEFEQYDDSIFYDEETGKLMKSVTLPGGDVEVVEYDGEDYQVIPY